MQNTSLARTLLHTTGLGLLLIAGSAGAAPKQIDLVYEATRNGQPFATVTETYRQQNGRYRIESVTEGLGAYALFGQRKLSSEGAVSSAGLKPGHFELHQGDNAKKSLFTDFDWASNKLNMQIKGKPVSVPLEKGAQDLSSFAYQFMFVPPAGEEVVLPVTTGKELNVYHYKVMERGVLLEVPAGKFKTVHIANTVKNAAEDEKELWLGAESYYLPVRITLRDEKGDRIEQTLTSLHAQ